MQNAFSNLGPMAVFVVGAALAGFIVLFWIGPKIRRWMGSGEGVSSDSLNRCRKCGRLVPPRVKICRDCETGKTEELQQAAARQASARQPQASQPAPAAQRPRVPDIIVAAHAGNAEMVRQLLQRGAKVNDEDEQEYTALHHAAMAGNMDVVQALVEGGANVNYGVSTGRSPLNLACQAGHDAVVKYLRQNGAR